MGEIIEAYANKDGYILEIRYDDFPSSPFDWVDDIYFCTFSSRYKSPSTYPDGVKTPNDLLNYLGEFDSIRHDGKIIFKEKGYIAYNVIKYEHSGVSYYIGKSAKGFDECNIGFIFVKEDEADRIFDTEEELLSFLKSLLNNYSDYCNGEVYEYALFDSKNEMEMISRCGDIYIEGNENLSNYIMSDIDGAMFMGEEEPYVVNSGINNENWVKTEEVVRYKTYDEIMKERSE